MGKTTETVENENTTSSSADLALLEAQEKISQLEAKLKEEQEARAEAEQTAESAQNEAKAAKDEAKKIASEAKAAIAEAKSEAEKNVKPTTTIIPGEEERVKIKLFKDSKEYKDDLTVVVNGKAYQIQRGVEVSVPKSVAEVIEHSAVQDQKTAELIDSLIAETEQREKDLR